LGFLFVLIVGLVAGTISGIVGTGSSIMLMPVLIYEYGPKQAVPIMAIAAEAASSLGLYFSKSVTFERFGALNADIALKGLIAGSSLMFGAFIAKRFVLHLAPDRFRLLIDGIMIAAGLSLLWTAATS
jgi:hypothetical protein